MGSGRAIGSHAARLGLRLHPGPADRAGIVAAALGCAARNGVAGCGLEYSCRVPAKADPYAVSYQVSDGQARRQQQSRWLWVPAFAGTTLEVSVSHSSFFGSFDIRSIRSCISFILLR